jgi:hypothetical protein
MLYEAHGHNGRNAPGQSNSQSMESFQGGGGKRRGVGMAYSIKAL